MTHKSLSLGAVVVFVLAFASAFLVNKRVDEVFVSTPPDGTPITHVLQSSSHVVEAPHFREGTMLFTGDSMLARHVEFLMDEYGLAYPFFGTDRYVRDADIALTNFEGSVPTVHVQTPSQNLSLSVTADNMKALHTAGFDVLSLANNHAYDFGMHEFVHTREVCAEHGLTCFGSPDNDVRTATTVVAVGDTRVGILFLHALYGIPDSDSLALSMNSLETNSDVQVVYIHWGVEYDLGHTNAQEILAHELIDDGADAIIGGHPHVVEDVAFYNGKPIFYSLGNFIFDQYFSPDVMEGLMISVHFTKDYIEYTLVPLESKTVHSQPRIASLVDRDVLLKRILEPLKDDSGVNVSAGTIQVQRS